MNLRLSLLTISALLVGCSWNAPPPVQPVKVVKVEVPAPVFHPVLPDKITPMDVEWRVLTPALMKEYVDDLDQGEAPVNVWYAVSTKGYENLSNNMAEIKRYIRQMLNIVEYYKNLADDQQEDNDGTIE